MSFKTLVPTGPRPHLRKKRPDSSFTSYRKHTPGGISEVTISYIREFLSLPEDEVVKLDPRDDKRSDMRNRTRFEKMLENMCKTASSPSHPLAVSAFNALMDRAHGKVKPSDAELGAIKGQAVQIQLVHVNQQPVDPEIAVETQRALAPQPDFIEGEFAEDENTQPEVNKNAER